MFDKIEREILAELKAIRALLERVLVPQVTSLTILLGDSPMPKTLSVGQTDSATFQEIGTGGEVLATPIPFDAPPVWASDTPAVGTVVASADGLSAEVTAVGPGVANISVSGAIGGKTVAGSGVLTVADTVASLNVVFG